MLPLPFYGVKKWAPTLIVDGIFSASLVFSYTLILETIEYFGKLFGSDWNNFYVWIGLKTGIITSFLVLLKIIGTGLSLGGLQFLANSIISSLISVLTNVLMLLLTISVISTVLTNYGAKLLALGIVLHSVPFRILRASGAMIISVIVVFTIGLPLMPVFVESISQPTTLPNSAISSYGLTYARIITEDHFGNRLRYPVISVYSRDKATLLAKYCGDRNGIVDATNPDKGLPGSAQYYILLEYCGLKIWIKIDPFSDYYKVNNNIYFRIKADNIAELGNRRIIYIKNGSIVHLTKIADGVFDATLNVIDNATLYVVLFKHDCHVAEVNGTKIEPSYITEYIEYGISYEIYEYHLSRGYYDIILEIEFYGQELRPNVSEKYYVRDTGNISFTDPINIITPIAYIIFNLFIGPIVYVAILFSASIALAKLLGGVATGIMRALTGGI